MTWQVFASFLFLLISHVMSIPMLQLNGVPVETGRAFCFMTILFCWCMFVEQSSPRRPTVVSEERPLVLRGEIRNYPVRVGEVADVWAGDRRAHWVGEPNRIAYRVVEVEDIHSDGVVVSVCRHPCEGNACPRMRVVLEPSEVLVPLSWLFWSPLMWCVILFFVWAFFLYGYLVSHLIGLLSW